MQSDNNQDQQDDAEQIKKQTAGIPGQQAALQLSSSSLADSKNAPKESNAAAGSSVSKAQPPSEKLEKQRIAQNKQSVEELMQEIRHEKSKSLKQQDGVSTSVAIQPAQQSLQTPDKLNTQGALADDIVQKAESATSSIKIDKSVNKREKKQQRKQGHQATNKINSATNVEKSQTSQKSHNSDKNDEFNSIQKKPQIIASGDQLLNEQIMSDQQNQSSPHNHQNAAQENEIQDKQASQASLQKSSPEGCSQVQSQTQIDSSKKQLFQETDSQPQLSQHANFMSKLKPVIRDKFDQIEGACDYFYVLEKDNEQIQEENLRQQLKDDGKSPADNEEKKRELHTLAKGYPQKHSYKFPKICNETCQTIVDSNEYKGSKEQYILQNQQKHLIVYQNQINDVPEIPGVKKKNQKIRMKTKRSNSVEVETLKFYNPQDNSSSDSSRNEKSKKRPKVYTNMNNQMIKRKIQRRDEMKAPLALNQEPKVSFVSDKNGKYDSKELDDYLNFCHFVMRESPIQGNYCGIWLRGSTMYKEKALQLLNKYDYNFDLARFHILYPQVMSDPDKSWQITHIAQTQPQELAKEVANAIIDLQGCKQDEIDQILNKFREDLSNRINDEQLKYHLTILQKIKIPTPADIEEKIRKSIEFSREIKKKCNIQAGSSKSASAIPSDKKLKMSELIDLFEEQKKYAYITQEMIVLQQQLDKARQWQQRVESIRDKEIHFRQIDQIYSDGKNIPVNFQDLMKEIKDRRQQAEQLNQKIQDTITVKKTRLRANETKRSRRSGAATNQGSASKYDDGCTDAQFEAIQDKEQQFRDLLEEAKRMKLQSDQITRLHNKVQDIDKWKQEVQALFLNHNEEIYNYKRYKDHYKSLLGRASPFQVELALMRDLQKKCTFIDWRTKVEELIERLQNEEKMTLEHIQLLLEEGKDKGFIQKDQSGFFTRLAEFENNEQNPVGEVKDVQTMPLIKEQEQMIQNNDSSHILKPLFCNFQKLDDIIHLYEDTKKYDRDLQKILEKVNMNKDEQDNNEDKSSQSNQPMSQHGILPHISELEQLEERGKEIKIEVENIKELNVILNRIRQAEKVCHQLVISNQVDGVLIIKSEVTLNQFLEARKQFLDQNIMSEKFMNFQIKILPYIHWLNRSSKLVKTYCRAALGLKLSQLNLYEPIDEQKDQYPSVQNTYNKDSDYKSIVALCNTMAGNQSNITGQFELFKDSEVGRYLIQILQRTDALDKEFKSQRDQKRSENFDMNKYFKLLDNIQSSGLPVEDNIIEEAKIELKREKWIKKFNDLQQAGSQNITSQNQYADSQSQSTQNKNSQQDKQHTLGGGQNYFRGHVRIKNVEVLIKEYQSNYELNQDNTCQKLANKLMDQHQKCQIWLNKFNEIFNSQNQFDPKGGTKQIEDLIKEGADLDLQLKEYLDLQTHQKELIEWNQINAQIFNNSKSVTLDQLKKHIKDTHDITEGQNPQLISLLDSLKEIATIWKIFAKTILKIRPIENFNGIVINFQNRNKQLQINNEQDLFCICRQPENAETGSLMLCCDFCDMWYHHTCVGLPTDLKLEKVKYKCIGCAIREGKIIHYGLHNLKHNLGNRVGNSPDGMHLHDQFYELNSQIDFGFGGGAVSGSGPQNNLRDMQQQEIENLLLEYFHQKQRISLSQFEFVITEGKQNVPLYLEELIELEFIHQSILKWRAKAHNEIIRSRHDSSSTIYENFKIINNLTNASQDHKDQRDQLDQATASEEDIIALQEQENDRDESLIRLIIESQSFPVYLQETLDLIQALRHRDWLRECLQIFYQFNQRNQRNSKEAGNAAKQNKINKQNKIQFRKDVKKQIYKGELIRDLSAPDAGRNQLTCDIEIVNDILTQLIVKPGGTNVAAQNQEEAGGPKGQESTPKVDKSASINTSLDLFSQIKFQMKDSHAVINNTFMQDEMAQANTSGLSYHQANPISNGLNSEAQNVNAIMVDQSLKPHDFRIDSVDQGDADDHYWREQLQVESANNDHLSKYQAQLKNLQTQFQIHGLQNEQIEDNENIQDVNKAENQALIDNEVQIIGEQQLNLLQEDDYQVIQDINQMTQQQIMQEQMCQNVEMDDTQLQLLQQLQQEIIRPNSSDNQIDEVIDNNQLIQQSQNNAMIYEEIGQNQSNTAYPQLTIEEAQIQYQNEPINQIHDLGDQQALENNDFEKLTIISKQIVQKSEQFFTQMQQMNQQISEPNSHIPQKLNEWLTKTANYTGAILEQGDNKDNAEMTQQFILEGESILHELNQLSEQFVVGPNQYRLNQQSNSN